MSVSIIPNQAQMDAIDAELAKVPQRIDTARELIARATARRSVAPIAKLLADATRIQKASFSRRIVAKVLPGNFSAKVSITDSRISAQNLDPSALATGGIHLGVAGLKQADFPSAFQTTYHQRKGKRPSKRARGPHFVDTRPLVARKAIFERQAAGRKGRALPGQKKVARRPLVFVKGPSPSRIMQERIPALMEQAAAIIADQLVKQTKSQVSRMLGTAVGSTAPGFGDEDAEPSEL